MLHVVCSSLPMQKRRGYIFVRFNYRVNNFNKVSVPFLMDVKVLYDL